MQTFFHRALIPLTFAAFLITITFFIVQPTEYLVGAFVIDDGLYYLEVPRNIVSGGGVTYDNRTITNGMHPLWGGIGVLMALVSGTESGPLLRTAMIVQALFVLLSLVCLWRIAARTGMEVLGGLLAMAALFFSRLDLWLSTMESAALLACLLALILLALRMDLLRSERMRDNILLGILLALVFLARLDTIFIVVAFLAVQAFEHLRGGFRPARLTSPIVSGAVFALITAPYLVLNKIHFGGFVPVSGMRKIGETPAMLENTAAVASSMLQAVSRKSHVPAFVLAAGIVVAIAAFVWMCSRPRVSGTLRGTLEGGVLPALVLGTILRAIYLLAYVEEYAHVPWYWVPEYLLGALLIAVVVTVTIRFFSWTWLRRPLPLYVITAAVFVAGVRYLVADARLHQESNRIVYDCATWAAANVPQDRLFAMNDSGVFAFFSNFDVIPLNGLITDRPTMERIHRGEYGEVMDRFGVDYLVHYIEQDTALPEHIVLYRSPVIPTARYRNHHVVIMKYKEYPLETLARGWQRTAADD